ncbi:MAG: RNA polymerase subunit sigma-70, partial [Muriicola sp.]|nr:RNA polymerase subunit sigma-70 [Muriicola sp.]
MKDKIRIFLETDLLEKYLLGNTSDQETLQVERYIAMYPEVLNTYVELQENLESFAKLHALKAPEGLKAKILHRIRTQDLGRKKSRRLAIAASVAAFLFAGSSYFFWDQSKSLQEENTIVTNRILNLEADMKQQLEDVRNQFIVLNNPQTRKFYVNGNNKAKDL